MDFLGDIQGPASTLGRLVLAAVLGGIVGFEREASGKPAGFRTNLLICLGAALITEVSIEVARDASLPGGWRSDPGRIAAQIVSGIGFLGAGTIMQTRGSVIGLTTAATMWVVAGIGIAVGAGAYAIALAGAVITLLALRTLSQLDDRLLSHRWTDRMLHVELKQGAAVSEIEKVLAATGMQTQLLELERREDRSLLRFRVRGLGPQQSTVDALVVHPDILRVVID